MDNFMTTLYGEYFKSINQEKSLRETHDFDNDNSAIRNDQRIADTMEQTKILGSLIERYLAYLTN